jgi:hypothetical protein
MKGIMPIDEKKKETKMEKHAHDPSTKIFVGNKKLALSCPTLIPSAQRPIPCYSCP